MRARRVWTMFLLELKAQVGRVSYWVLLALMFMMIRMLTWDLAHAPGAHSGGTQLFLNSQMVIAMTFSFFYFHFPTFFLALAAGRAMVRDDMYGLGPLFNATPLTPGEYVWAKFAAVQAAFLGVILFQCLVMAVLCGPLRNAAAPRFYGPFLLRAYLWPVLAMLLPLQTFVAGTAFGLGTRTRNLYAVVLLPVVIFLLSFKFLPIWHPEWLEPRWNTVLMWLEPTGLRWLLQTWDSVDLGGAFYNQSRLTFDLPFLASRLAWAGVGLGFVAWSLRAFRREAREADAGAAPALPAGVAGNASFAAADLRTPLRRPGGWEALGTVFRLEVRSLAAQPGWYLFAALALVDTFLRARSAADPLTGVALLLTSGGLALRAGRNLSLILCVLLLFSTGESLERERAARMDMLVRSCPMPSLALRAGKVMAGLSLAGLLLAADALLAMGILAFQGQPPLRPGVFLAVWALVLAPTLLVWTAFVWAVQELTRNRFTTYAVGLGALAVTGFCIHTGHLTWAGNWLLFDNLVWSDLCPLELDRTTLVLNRIMVLALAGFFGVLAWAAHARRERDAAASLGRWRALHRNPRARALLALAVVPALLAGYLAHLVATGCEGEGALARRQGYVGLNAALWRGAALPEPLALELDLDLDPATGALGGQGHWVVRNGTGRALDRVPMTVPSGYEAIAWTLDGAPCPAEDRSGLHILPAILEPGQERRIGFRFRGRVAPGATRNGGPRSFFLLPSGGLMAHRQLVPVVGFQEDPGVTGRFTTRLRLSGPAGFDFLSVGTRSGDQVVGGRRTVSWTSVGPVGQFGVQVGRWQVARGMGAEVYHHPGHGGNVPSLLAALEASREHYARWYGPMPYPQFRLAEVPGLDRFAASLQGLIPFSENFGFLCRRDGKFDQAFGVAAHEAAHQWWGNLVTPAPGPGSRVLTEGLANFSAALLYEVVKGPAQRIAFMRFTESLFERARPAQGDLPLLDDRMEGPGGAALGGSRAYNKGAWVFWMLMEHMGREPFLAGLRDFQGRYRDRPDPPVLLDLLAALRGRAEDPEAFDAFAGDWFRGVELPAYRITAASRTRQPGGAWEAAFTLENQGGTRMPVTVAVTGRGGRATLAVAPLGAGERQRFTLACPFQPERIEVDPEVRILQRRRREAVHRF